MSILLEISLKDFKLYSFETCKFFTNDAYKDGELVTNDVSLLKYKNNIKKLKIKNSCEFNINLTNEQTFNQPFALMNDDILVFEFENEEDAFYFKMKYC